MGYRKITIGTVKTTTRVRKGKVQTIKLFTKNQKLWIISEVAKGTSRYDLRVTDVLKMYGVTPPVYYSWVRNNNNPQNLSLNIVLKSQIDLLKLSEKLKKIEEIESVYFN